MASTVVAVGLTIAAAGFAGRYVLQAMKHVEPQVKQVFQSLPKSAFSGGYYRGGFEPKMTKREALQVDFSRHFSLISGSQLNCYKRKHHFLELNWKCLENIRWGEMNEWKAFSSMFQIKT